MRSVREGPTGLRGCRGVRECSVASVTSKSLGPHGLQTTKLLCPWDPPGKNTGVGCHALLQGIFLTRGSNLCLPVSPALWADSLPTGLREFEVNVLARKSPHSEVRLEPGARYKRGIIHDKEVAPREVEEGASSQGPCPSPWLQNLKVCDPCLTRPGGHNISVTHGRHRACTH